MQVSRRSFAAGTYPQRCIRFPRRTDCQSAPQIVCPALLDGQDVGASRRWVDHPAKPGSAVVGHRVPIRKENVDTYRYLGAPVFIYSLKDGVNDGFLTPFQYSGKTWREMAQSDRSGGECKHGRRKARNDQFSCENPRKTKKNKAEGTGLSKECFRSPYTHVVCVAKLHLLHFKASRTQHGEGREGEAGRSVSGVGRGS